MKIPAVPLQRLNAVFGTNFIAFLIIVTAALKIHCGRHTAELLIAVYRAPQQLSHLLLCFGIMSPKAV